MNATATTKATVIVLGITWTDDTLSLTERLILQMR